MWDQMLSGMTGGSGGQSDSSTTAMGTGAPIHNAGVNFGVPPSPTWSSVGPGGVQSLDLTKVLLIGGAVVVLALALKGRK